ncbi:hypothetical protein TELCIR_15235 [Teladorsagia circumcincta]|uniref:Receptor ligand binding region domain-containing protein n=1 Tax=Teladorsagia circumcincta TaxID=45464 RepID=A0A2G9TYR4_TELCI|nr:hypothetical protein TELCIR_15235 [Teladorsagia circumcincta]
MIGYLSTYYKKTMLGWGFLIDSKFSDNDRFKYLTKVMPDSLEMMYALLELFKMFEWNRVAIYYTPNEVDFCDTIVDDALNSRALEALGYSVVRDSKIPVNSRAVAVSFVQNQVFRFVVNYTECSSRTAVGVALEYMVKQNVDLVIGPPCPPR